MAYSKIGFHGGINANMRGIGDFMSALDREGIPFAVKSADDIGFAVEAASYTNADHNIVLRLTMPLGHGDDLPDFSMAPAQAAEYHWKNVLLPSLRKDPNIEGVKDRVWIETANEPDKNKADWLGFFALELAQYANDDGWKIIPFAMNAGEPEPEGWHVPGMKAFLKYAAANRDRVGVGLHEGLTHPELNVNSNLEDAYNWIVGRFEWLFAECDKMGIGRPTVFVSEWAWAYNDMPDQTKAMADVRWLAELAAKYPTVRGIYLWNLQVGKTWKDLGNRLVGLIEPIKEFNLTASFPDPDPVEDEPKPSDYRQLIWLESLAHDRDNGDAALRKAIMATGQFHPYGNEFWVTDKDGQTWAVQTAFNWTTDQRRVYYCPVPNWADIRYLDGPPATVGGDGPLDVAIMSQRDPRWSYVILGQNTGHGKTIGNWGCLLIAQTMWLNFMGVSGLNPIDMNAHYVAKGAFYQQYLKNGAMAIAFPKQVEFVRYIDRNNAQLVPEIKAYVDAGIPVTVRVDFVPSTSAWEQHWVLVTGYSDNDFYMADPWTGREGWLSEVYGIAGQDIITAEFHRLKTIQPPTSSGVDMWTYFMPPEGREYGPGNYLVNNWGEGGEWQQLQRDGNRSYVVKNQQYECREVGPQYVSMIVDTSPGNNEYYTVEGVGFPRFWKPGDHFDRSETIRFFQKGNCQPVPGKDYVSNSRVRFAAFFPVWDCPSGVRFTNVIEMNWVLNGVIEERYYYAPGWGLIEWKNRWGKHSYTQEINEQMPRATREQSACYPA